jgi:RNA polymerase sigma-70 factor, ECF subfamily
MMCAADSYSGEDPAPTDADLAAQAATDREAFLTLYDRYVGAVERYVAARTNSSDVEDLVSATFTRALSQIGRYRPERGAFAAWLFTIARNMIVDHYRRQARAFAVTTGRAVTTGESGPEEAAVAAEERRKMWSALAQLTPEQSDALALRYGADLPFATIAASLGKSEAAAKMLVQRGLHSLRRHLEEDARHD